MKIFFKKFQFAINEKKITRLLKLFGFFSMLATKIESRLNFCRISYLVHSQIWLNIPKDDRHFSYIFLCMTITKATLKKKHWGRP
jgi:hypothetical protein